MRKAVRILLLIPSLYLVIAPLWYSHWHNTKLCSSIEVTIVDSADYHFVTKRDIVNTILKRNGNMVGKTVKDIDTDAIEETMRGYRELLTAEVFISIDGVLHIVGDQRTPVMRVMAADGGDYYVDEEGVVIRRRNLYTPRLHIVGGNVNISQAMLNGVSVLDTSIKNSILKDIFYLVGHINRDDFWANVDGHTALIGVSDFLQKTKGDVAFLETVETGTEVKQSQELGKIETIKATFGILSPVTGKVIEVNQELEASSYLINEDPYGAGWIYRIELTDFEGDQKELLQAEDYMEIMKVKIAEEMEKK